MPEIQWVRVRAVKPNPRNARTHSKKQVKQIARSISLHGGPLQYWSTKTRTIGASYFEKQLLDRCEKMRVRYVRGAANLHIKSEGNERLQ
jgi:hypothetical protein